MSTPCGHYFHNAWLTAGLPAVQLVWAGRSCHARQKGLAAAYMQVLTGPFEVVAVQT